MKQNYLQVSAFVLHAKPFKENSQILQLFSLEQGRFSVIAKGVKGKRSQARKAILQPFNELTIHYIGKSELKTLTQCDLVTSPSFMPGMSLQGKVLACGYYANELLLRALPERHDYPELYFAYRQFISSLKEEPEVAPLLRNFEIALLTAMGIAPDCEFDIEQNPIDRDKQYTYIQQSGFKLAEPSVNYHSINVGIRESGIGEPGKRETAQKVMNERGPDYGDSYSGQAILSLSTGEYYSEHLKASQQITHLLLREVIGDKPLQSRKLWQHMGLANMENLKKPRTN